MLAVQRPRLVNSWGGFEEDDRVVHRDGRAGEIHLHSNSPGWVYVLYDNGDYRIVDVTQLRPEGERA